MIFLSMKHHHTKDENKLISVLKLINQKNMY